MLVLAVLSLVNFAFTLASFSSNSWLLLVTKTRSVLGSSSTTSPFVIDSITYFYYGLQQVCADTGVEVRCDSSPWDQIVASAGCLSQSSSALKDRFSAAYAFIVLSFCVSCFLTFWSAFHWSLRRYGKRSLTSVPLPATDNEESKELLGLTFSKSLLIGFSLCGVELLFLVIGISVFGGTVGPWLGCGNKTFCDAFIQRSEVPLNATTLGGLSPISQNTKATCSYSGSFAASICAMGVVLMISAWIGLHLIVVHRPPGEWLHTIAQRLTSTSLRETITGTTSNDPPPPTALSQPRPPPTASAVGMPQTNHPAMGVVDPFAAQSREPVGTSPQTPPQSRHGSGVDLMRRPSSTGGSSSASPRSIPPAPPPSRRRLSGQEIQIDRFAMEAPFQQPPPPQLQQSDTAPFHPELNPDSKASLQQQQQQRGSLVNKHYTDEKNTPIMLNPLLSINNSSSSIGNPMMMEWQGDAVVVGAARQGASLIGRGGSPSSSSFVPFNTSSSSSHTTQQTKKVVENVSIVPSSTTDVNHFSPRPSEPEQQSKSSVSSLPGKRSHGNMTEHHQRGKHRTAALELPPNSATITTMDSSSVVMPIALLSSTTNPAPPQGVTSHNSNNNNPSKNHRRDGSNSSGNISPTSAPSSATNRDRPPPPPPPPQQQRQEVPLRYATDEPQVSSLEVGHDEQKAVAGQEIAASGKTNTIGGTRPSSSPGSSPNNRGSSAQQQGKNTSSVRATSSPEAPPPPGGSNRKLVPQGEDWVYDARSKLYYSEMNRLFFDDGSGHFYDPETEHWFNPTTDQWYSLKEEEKAF